MNAETEIEKLQTFFRVSFPELDTCDVFANFGHHYRYTQNPEPGVPVLQTMLDCRWEDAADTIQKGWESRSRPILPDVTKAILCYLGGRKASSDPTLWGQVSVLRSVAAHLHAKYPGLESCQVPLLRGSGGDALWELLQAHYPRVEAIHLYYSSSHHVDRKVGLEIVSPGRRSYPQVVGVGGEDALWAHLVTRGQWEDLFAVAEVRAKQGPLQATYPVLTLLK